VSVIFLLLFIFPHPSFADIYSSAHGLRDGSGSFCHRQNYKRTALANARYGYIAYSPSSSNFQIPKFPNHPVTMIFLAKPIILVACTMKLASNPLFY